MSKNINGIYIASSFKYLWTAWILSELNSQSLAVSRAREVFHVPLLSLPKDHIILIHTQIH